MKGCKTLTHPPNFFVSVSQAATTKHTQAPPSGAERSTQFYYRLRIFVSNSIIEEVPPVMQAVTTRHTRAPPSGAARNARSRSSWARTAHSLLAAPTTR